MAIRASTLPLFLSLSVGDGTGGAVTPWSAGVSLALLRAGGHLRPAALVGMLAIDYLVSLAASVRG